MNDDFWRQNGPPHDSINNKVLRWLLKIESCRQNDFKMSSNKLKTFSYEKSLKSFVMQISIQREHSHRSQKRLRRQFRKDTTSEQTVNYLRQTKSAFSREIHTNSGNHEFTQTSNNSIQDSTNVRSQPKIQLPSRKLLLSNDKKVSGLFSIVQNFSRMADQIEETLEENKQVQTKLKEKIDMISESKEKPVEELEDPSTKCSSCQEVRGELEQILRCTEEFTTRNSIIKKITSILEPHDIKYHLQTSNRPPSMYILKDSMQEKQPIAFNLPTSNSKQQLPLCTPFLEIIKEVNPVGDFVRIEDKAQVS